MLPASSGKQTAVQRLMRLVTELGLPEIELSTSYGDPSLKLRGKVMMTVKEAGIVYLPCPLEIKEVLLEIAPHIYYQTDHYQGWPGILIRLDMIDDEELGLRLEDAWRYRAPRKLAATRPTAGSK